MQILQCDAKGGLIMLQVLHTLFLYICKSVAVLALLSYSSIFSFESSTRTLLSNESISSLTLLYVMIPGSLNAAAKKLYLSINAVKRTT